MNLFQKIRIKILKNSFNILLNSKDLNECNTYYLLCKDYLLFIYNEKLKEFDL